MSRNRFLSLAVSVSVLLAGAVALAGPPASAAAEGPIVHTPSGLCLDVRGRSTAVGATVQLYGCHGGTNQAWSVTDAGELRTYGGTRCLAAVRSGGSTRPQLAMCSGAAAQQFRPAADGTIVATQSGLCLDGGSGAASTTVTLATCTGQPRQRWTLPGAAGDTTPPTPPSGLLASGLSCNRVTLSWSAATDDVGVAFYDLYHDGQLVTSVAGTTRSATVTVTPGVAWGWYVNARDAAGNVSQASETLTVAPPYCSTDTVPPSAPGGLTAVADGTSVTLTWTASTDDVGVTAYEVRRDGVAAGTVTGAPPATTFTDSGLAAGTTYSYTVVARDAQGNRSPASAAASVTTGGACANPICGITQVTTETDLPWGLVQLPGGTVLYSRRDRFEIVAMNPDGSGKHTVGKVPGVAGTDGEGGVLGLAVSADFATDRWLYVYHTSSTDNRIVRIRLDDAQQPGALQLDTEQVLVTGIPRNKYHNGGRLRFGPDGMLYASAGDGQDPDTAQDLDSLGGKVLRLRPDGAVPADNPFPGSYVYSYGHRNPQGLAFDSHGRLWEQEFGNNLLDETNVIRPGGNYGWPQCEGTVGTCTPDLVAPVRTYPVAQGSCSGIAIVRDVLYVACLRGDRLYRAVIDDSGSGPALTDVTQHYVGTYHRLRTVEPTIDGDLWLTTSTGGDKDSVPDNSNERIFRVTLAR